MRQIKKRYQDPLESLWLEAAQRIGISIKRTSEAYAYYDGKQVLYLGEEKTLDPDDCLAQMIFHELCHSITQGFSSFSLPDWGLDNLSDRDVAAEYACLRLQHALASQYGLKQSFAPTTEHRAFYDALTEEDVLDEPTEMALSRSHQAPWQPHLHQALRVTQNLLGSLQGWLPSDHLFYVEKKL